MVGAAVKRFKDFKLQPLQNTNDNSASYSSCDDSWWQLADKMIS